LVSPKLHEAETKHHDWQHFSFGERCCSEKEVLQAGTLPGMASHGAHREP
jgi:hypothetical protein